MKELLNVGIQPQMLLCRCDRVIPENERAQDRAVLQCAAGGGDCRRWMWTRSMQVPISYHHEGMDREVLRHFGLAFDAPSRFVALAEDIVDTMRAPEGEVRIAVVGKYMNAARQL